MVPRPNLGSNPIYIPSVPIHSAKVCQYHILSDLNSRIKTNVKIQKKKKKCKFASFQAKNGIKKNTT